MGVNGGYFSAELRFDEQANYRLEQYVAGASVGYRASPTVSLRLGVGAIIDGRLEGEGQTHTVEPGWVASAQVSKRWFGRGDEVPFLATSVSFGVARSKTTLDGSDGNDRLTLTGTDLRFGALFGITWWETWSPYLSARLFGGPVFWKRGTEDAVGSDRHKFALGAGSVINAGSINLVIDSSFLGERSLSGGASFSF